MPPSPPQSASERSQTSVAASPTGRARRLGLAIQGVGGAVATTAAAGLMLLRRGLIDTTGLPLARLAAQQPQVFAQLGLAGYDQIVIAGWDVGGADLLSAAREHQVLPPHQLEAVGQELSGIRPWQAIATQRFASSALRTDNQAPDGSHRDAITRVADDLARFRREAQLDGLVLINLSSTEAPPPSGDCFQTPDALERALDVNDSRISASVLYAYASITAGVPHVNFTPSRCTDWPAMIALAQQRGVPICGKDGKTGQTLLKTVLAPAFRDRNLQVEGWYSTNLLGNRDGQVLADPHALQSKLSTKTDVLEAILGYAVPDHQVHIHYYRPRGDAKEAWDNIDLSGFAGQAMQVKVNFLCRDSILAAPLVIDLGRLTDLAQLRKCRGPVAELAAFFKSPIIDVIPSHHEFGAQQRALELWLESACHATTT